MSTPTARTPPSIRKVSRSINSTPTSPSSSDSSPTYTSPPAVPPSYRESFLSPPYNYCTTCTSPIPDIFLHPRPAPPIPSKSASRLPHSPKRDLHDLEAAITRIEAHQTVARRANELYHDTSAKRRHQLPKCSKRICLLLFLNLCTITVIAVAGYMGTTARGVAKRSLYWCNFTNALPKSLISAGFVFAVAVSGLTPYAQRMLSGRFWTQLLYVFFLFQVGGIVGALNNGITITVVNCPAH